MYQYYVSNCILYSGMQEEAIQEYKNDDVMVKMAKNARKLLYRRPEELIRDKV